MGALSQSINPAQGSLCNQAGHLLDTYRLPVQIIGITNLMSKNHKGPTQFLGHKSNTQMVDADNKREFQAINAEDY